MAKAYYTGLQARLITSIQVQETRMFPKIVYHKEVRIMRINNNIMALNAHRMLGTNQGNAARSMEKLSSGFRINRAGDDAAGLAISEKMRGQIRGLNQASRNAQDGISLIQTAEGALNETHAILQRMRELAVQSSTDTNTEVDRGEIQKEIDQLSAEITRIADTTEFNTQTLMNGKFAVKFHIGANEGQNVKLAVNAMDAKALGVAGEEGIELEVKTAEVDGFVSGAAYADVAEESFDVQEIAAADVAGVTGAKYILVGEDGKAVAASADGKEYTLFEAAVEVDDLASAVAANNGESTSTDLGAFTFADAVTSGKVTFSAIDGGKMTASGVHMIEFADEKLASGTYTVVGEEHHLIESGAFGLVDSSGDLVAVSADGKDWKTLGGADLFSIGTGYGAGDELEVSSGGGIDVSSQVAADQAITTINDAIESVSAERSKLGAMQNRLEHTIANLGTSAENLQAAESRVRDLDMAEEIMAFTKNSILQQAATAMLAQANMAPQSVLQLLG